MQIKCDQCNAAFNIDESKVPEEGARAKCTKCGSTIIIKKKTTAEKFTCPKCGAERNAGEAECAKCGIIYAKSRGSTEEKNSNHGADSRNDTKDPWMIFAEKMAEEFFSKHRETMPENPHDVWDAEEVLFFCVSFVLVAAKYKFKLKNVSAFTRREAEYLNLFNQRIIDTPKESISHIALFLKRYTQYSDLFSKGSGSLFAAITGSICKPACKAFVPNACKRYIYSERDLVKIIAPWVLGKWKEFDKFIELGRVPITVHGKRGLDTDTITESATETALCGHSYPVATRWPRFFARTFDIWWETLFILFLLFVAGNIYFIIWPLSISSSIKLLEWLETPGFDIWLTILFVWPLVLIVDAFLYRIVGNTPGKAFLRLKVTSLDGKPLSFYQYLGRNFSLWKRGFALGIPILYFFTMTTQYRRLGKGQQTNYDEYLGVMVQSKPSGLVRKVAFGLIYVFLFFVVIMVNDLAKRKSTSVQEKMAPSEVSRFDPTKPYTVENPFLSKSTEQAATAQQGHPPITASNMEIKKAQEGDAETQYQFGSMYFTGQGAFVPQDDKQAVIWTQKAAEQGYALAQILLGFMYEKGRGVPQDYKQAVAWYRKAAEQGNTHAQFNLGVMYDIGQGVPQDDVNAYAWFSLAAAQGFEIAVKNRDIVARKLTPVQHSNAQAIIAISQTLIDRLKK